MADIESILRGDMGVVPFGRPAETAKPPTPGAPAAAPAAATPQQKAPLDFSGMSMGVQPLPERPKPPSVYQDVKSTALGALPKALIGVGVGGAGSLGKGLVDITQMGRDAWYNGLAALDRISPEQARIATSEPLGPTYNPSEAEGRSFFGIPTYKGVTSSLENLSKQGLLAPELSYQPQTNVGKLLGSGIEGAVQSLPGGFGTIGGRVITGGLAATSGEAGRQYSEGTPSEKYFPILTSLVGGTAAAGLTNAVEPLLGPSAVARSRLDEALARDLQRDPSRREALQRAIESGLPVSVYDYAGDETKKLLQRAAATSDDAFDTASDINELRTNRAAGANTRTLSELSAVVGLPLREIDASALTKITEQAGRDERDRLYSLMKSTPAASDILLSDISRDILRTGYMQEAMRAADDLASNAPQYKMVRPQPPVYDPVLGYIRNETPGNLAYFDYVQRILGEAAGKAERAGDNTIAGAYRATRDKLLKDLEGRVPEYPTVRGKAAETFASTNAPEAGYNFFSTQGAFKRADIEDALSSYTDEQRGLFKVGFANRLVEDLKSGGPEAVYKRFQDGNFADRARLALGDEAFDRMNGYVASELALTKAKNLTLPGKPPEKPLLGGSIPGLAKGAGTGIAMDFLMNQAFGLGPITSGLAAAGATIGAISSKAEQMVGRRLLEQAMSQDPKQLQRLGEDLRRQPSLNKIFNKMMVNLTQAEQQAAGAYAPTPPAFSTAPASPENDIGAQTVSFLQRNGLMGGQPPAGQASGGRVGYRSGGRILDHGSKADALVRAAENARKTISGTTEPLLDLPDEHVVKALAVAGEAI